MDKKTLAIYKLFQDDPGLALLEVLRRQMELTEELVGETKGGRTVELKGAKEIKGDQGEPGYTPVRGTDYFTKDDIAFIKKLVTPKKGADYFTKAEIDAFVAKVEKLIHIPKRGVDFYTAEDKKEIIASAIATIQKVMYRPKRGVDFMTKADLLWIEKQITDRIKQSPVSTSKNTPVDTSAFVVGVGTRKITVSSTAPENPQEGDLWVSISK